MIADPEVSVTDGTTKPITSTKPTSPTESTTTAGEDASEANTATDSHSEKFKDKEELKENLSHVHANRKEQKSEQNGNEETDDNSVNMGTNGEENLKLDPVCDGYAVDPDSGEYIRVWEIAKRRRITEILHESISTLTTIEASVMTFHGPNGEAFEIHPATAPELILRNEQGDIVARLDQDLSLKPDTPAREKEKAKLCAEAHYSKTLQNILTVGRRGNSAPLSYRIPRSARKNLWNASYVCWKFHIRAACA